MKRGIIFFGALCVLCGFLCATLVSSVQAHPGIDEQIAHVTAMIEEEPRNAVLFLRRGELHRIHRDWKLAAADLREARKIDPELSAVDFCLGKVKLDEGKPAAAKRALDRYLTRRPGDADALAFRGRALREMGRPLEAAESFTRAVAAVPDDRPRPEYYFERAQALEAAGTEHLGEAVRGLDEGIQRLGSPVVLENYAIELELKRGNSDAALARLDRQAARAQRKESWLVRRGEILEDAGRLNEARVAYRSSLDAIEILPPSRRTNRAVERLQEQATTALKRLDERERTR